MIKEYEFHKIADIFPLLKEKEFEELKEDIKLNGLRQSIILYENKILDGRNRYNACKKLNINPKFEFYKGDSPLQFVISLNLIRRHLTESQRAVLSLDILPFFEEEARKRQTLGKKIPKVENKGKSSEKISKILKVNPHYISDIKKINKIKPEIIDKIRKGNKTITEAKKEIKIDNIYKEKEKIKEEAKLIEKKENIILGDCLEEIKKLKNDSISCVIIDSPYALDYQSRHRIVKHKKIIDDNEKIFEVLEKSFIEVIPKLKKDSHIYIFTSWKVIEKVIPIAKKYFELKNCLVWNKNNWTAGDLEGNYAEKYEMILFCSLGKKNLLNDKRPVNVLNFDRANCKFHPTEKPVELLKELIKNSTFENEIVLDYFAGSGSLGVACKELNRNFILIEKDEDYFNIMKNRLK